MPATLISIIGPPAAGKTTLAEHLAAELPAELLREDYAGNPFLEPFYLGRADLALPAQLYFLFSRAGQLSRARWPGEGTVISDYGFCQDAIYAGRGLTGDERATYDRLAAAAARRVKAPDAVVHLDGPEGLLLERIARRGRRHEADFDAGFLAEMRRSYEAASAAMTCPVVRIDVARTDLSDAGVRAGLTSRLREATT